MGILKNGNIYLGGGEYRPGWDIAWGDDGCITAVGQNLAAPAGETIIDAEGKNVYPGIVVALCASGAMQFAEFAGIWDLDETSSPITPEMDIGDALDLRELRLQRFGRAGITSYGLSPGTKNLLSGQVSLIHTAGKNTADVFLARRIALKGNYTAAVRAAHGKKGAPQTHMAMFQMLDEAFRAAKAYGDKPEKDYDAGKETLLRALSREIPVFLAANSQNEIESVLEIGKKHNLRLVITGGYGLLNCAEAIMAADVPVILGDAGNMLVGEKNHLDHAKLVALYRNGLKLSIFSSGDEGYGNAYEQIHWVAARMRQGGATADEVMDMMTRNPAEALGVAPLVGSLAPGKQADFFISHGNPAERFDCRIVKTVAAGNVIFEEGGAPRCC
jgi:imidazolonepropionase-like amidohydrolase